jgi:choline monooxygenase
MMQKRSEFLTAKSISMRTSLLPLSIDADIRTARTLPATFYRDKVYWKAAKEAIFLPSWQYIGSSASLPQPGHAHPFRLLPGFLDEPLMISHDGKQVHCLSNVCTHRANLIIESPGPCRELRCRYHGRRFGLDGTFRSMPEFQQAENFPADADHLPKIEMHNWGPLYFLSLGPDLPFRDWLAPVSERLSWLPLTEFDPYPHHTHTYEIRAHWALYCDNYLEGFHIPFVHPKLNQVLSYPDYRYELFPGGSLQVGQAKPGEAVFDIPPGHPDHGKPIAAYYFWLFPNLMLNFYPWGLSLNLVEPVSKSACRVRFETFLWKPELYHEGSQADLHQTEMEDESVVENVQAGISSWLYDRGRYSPKMEVAVHHFHRLIARTLSGSE